MTLRHTTRCLYALSAAGLMAAAVQTRAANLEGAAAPFLGRWNVTLHTPQRDFSSWLDIEQDTGTLRVRMVGRWGHARWLPDAEIANGRIRFVSPRAEEARTDSDMVFEGERRGEELLGNTQAPDGERWTWRAERAPALRANPIVRWSAPIQLFDGKRLAGWNRQGGASSWHVENGSLVSLGSGADLRTVAEYRDFKLHIEFNCAPGANSGVYLRGRYEVQIEDGSENGAPSERTGGVYGFIAPIEPARAAPGVWHAYDITLIGRRVTEILDGKVLIDHADIPGTTGGALDSHEALPGPILLQGSEPGRVAYRNIVLTPLFTAATDAPTKRVQRLLAALSRAEKLAILRGAHEPAAAEQGEAGWTAGVPRLGIPDLRFADGPPGVLVRHASSGMPATLAMASTFSRKDSEATGALIGRDARSLGIDVILQPYINLYRDPTFERAYNTLGEDPLLTGTLAASFVQGAQGQNVMAQAKHFVAYEGGDDVQVDGRTLREVYIAPFAQVSSAGVSSIMCSYNRINAIHACDNEWLLNSILRGEEDFAGFVTSDWGATHGAEFITHGLDMEQPGTGPTAYFALGKEPDDAGMSAAELDELDEIMTQGVPEEQRHAVPKPVDMAPRPQPAVSKNLGEAFERGTVTDQDVDRAAARVLSQMERFGWLDHPPSHAVHAEPVEQNARLIQRLAERGAVLLKNDGVLPLDSSALSSLALIGPGAVQTFAIVNGQEQSYGRAERQIGAIKALTAQGFGQGMQAAVADDMTGEPIPKEAYSGLIRMGDPSSLPISELQIDFTRKSGRPLAAGTRAAWQGMLIIPEEGDYDINLQILGATGKFWIDEKKVGDMGWWGGHGDIVFANRDNVVPTTDGLDNVRRLVHLKAGPHALRVAAAADGSGDSVQVRLAWVTPSMRTQNFSKAVELAQRSKVCVVFAWSRNRPYFGLPGDQDRLIDAISRVNPHTVVILNTGQAVAMPWLDKVSAVLEMWYTGDEGGWAAANLLTGRANPGGKLPISWPKRFEDYAVMDPHHPERVGHGVNGKTAYDEGLLVGYRWFDQQKIEPLFPFGHGLSYSTFEYSNLRLSRAEDGGVTVKCRIRNLSKRPGDAVVQAYLSAPDPKPDGVEFPPRTLADFERVHLKAHDAREVELHLAPERLRYWSVREHAWQDARRGRTLFVGSSSRDLPLSGAIPLEERNPARRADQPGAAAEQ